MLLAPFSSSPVFPAADARPALRRAVPQLRPVTRHPAVELTLAATPPGGLHYELVSYWEERCRRTVQRTTLTKHITLDWEQPDPGAAVLTYRTAPPALQKPELSALEKALVLLATLYQRLEWDATPTGQLLALRNHAEVLQTWEQVKEELVRRSGGTDEVTQILLTSVETQLQRPERLLASLRHDYAFAFLLPDLYQQRFESGMAYEQEREFPHFFTDTSCWFQERLAVGAPPAAGQATLHLSGTLDATRTDLTAVAYQLNAALAAVGEAPLGAESGAALQGRYEATFHLDAATGWPVWLEVSVQCRAGGDYSKEYFLRLEQLPAAP